MEKDRQDHHLELILEAAQSIVEGDFSKEVAIDAEGIVANLASVINQIIRKLRDIPEVLHAADSQAPQLSCDIENIQGLVTNSTGVVLGKADEILNHCDELEEILRGCEKCGRGLQAVKRIKACAFDVISAQSYQDCARQEIEKMEEKLQLIRDALIKVLIALNLRKETYTLKESTQKLIDEVKIPSSGAGRLEQDLVDELLAEFGL